MFPREITTTSVWIRHQLPLYAPLPPDGDRKLRRQIRSKYQNKTEEEISEIVQKERARLDLKWCFDEYFGWPIAHPSLGQIVTANVFGNVHLGYIVDITHSSIILVSIDTLTVLPAVNPDDIYSADCSPFFENYLHDQRVYHSQHILDWWSSSKYNQRCQDTKFSSSNEILSLMCPDMTSDWPVGNETWFTHDVLPQRIEFINCHEEEIVCISTENMIKNAQQHPMLFPDLFPTPADHSMRPIHDSNPCVMTTDQQYNSSVQANIQDHVITQGPQLSHSTPCLHKQSHLLPSAALSSSFVRQPKNLILLICLITVLSQPDKHSVGPFPLLLPLELVLGSLFIYHFYTQTFGCSLVLHDINNRDWFRALAVP